MGKTLHASSFICKGRTFRNTGTRMSGAGRITYVVFEREAREYHFITLQTITRTQERKTLLRILEPQVRIIRQFLWVRPFCFRENLYQQSLKTQHTGGGKNAIRHFEKIFEVPERCVTIHTTKDRDHFLYEMGVSKIEDEDMIDENRLDLGGALILRVRGVRA